MSDSKLFYTPGACSLAGHILLEYIKEKKGTNYSIEKVDLATHKTEDGKDYYTINERGAVPALQSSAFGKEVLTQNPAILNYIANNSGIEDLMHKSGSVKQARVDEGLGFCGDLHVAIATMFHIPETGDRTAALEKAHKRLKALEDWLPANKTWWLGDHFTQADLYLGVILSWCKPLKVDLTAYPKARKLREAVFSLPAAQTAIKAEGFTAQDYSF